MVAEPLMVAQNEAASMMRMNIKTLRSLPGAPQPVLVGGKKKYYRVADLQRFVNQIFAREHDDRELEKTA